MTLKLCLILFANHVHPTYKLIVAANRDEFFDRPTSPVHYWEDYPHILAGRDLKQMGTWMGVTKAGRFAALTNFRDPKEVSEGKRSRGELVADFLKNNTNSQTYMKKVAEQSKLYPGYNLLVGDRNQLYIFSNIRDAPQKVESGVHGVSNHLLNTAWPKVKLGKEELAKIINDNNQFMVEQLFTLLQNAEPARDEILPKTGVPLEWERLLSPLFIKSERYGTRSSTVLLMSDEEIVYTERVYSGEGIKDQSYTLKL